MSAPTSAPPTATWDELALADHHRAELVKSGISPEVARERGYRTATTIREVKRLGFAESQCQVPGLLIPIYTLGLEVASYQFKPDMPRIKDGRPNKYESPHKSLCQLDVPPRARVWILDPEQPLVFTEGVKKGDSGASHEIACLDVAGVWNWRSVDVIATLDQIDLKGRTVYLAFDSDYRRNAQVRTAKKRLAAVLRQRGAIVYDILLPESTLGIKVGLDDYLANGGSQVDLFRLEMVELTGDSDDETSHDPAVGSYAATPAGIVYRKPTQNGPVDQLLSNFTARIAEEVIADDGASERAELAIEGELGGKPLPRIRVPSRRFSSLDWVNSEWGARPIVNAGMGNRDRVREAIQRLSPEIERRHVYEHSGWRNLPGLGWCYLHAGGAIGAEGAVSGVDVALRGAASRMLLPDPPQGAALQEAVRASLSLLDLAPDAITAPLWGAVFRAVLCELIPADVSLFLMGPTGVFKSELAALAMQHYGVGFERLNLPAHWSATANFLERIAFDHKDALLVIDDFAPGGSQIDVARLHAAADRVFRGAGNRGGRGRMAADGSLRSDYPPRGLIIGTGEDAPRGQSLRSRVMILEVAPGDVSQERLTIAQEAGRRGLFVGTLGRFTQYLAPQLDTLSASLPSQLATYRDLAHHNAAHARTPEAVAHLALGWWAFLRFAAAVEAVTEIEAQATFDRVWTALGETAGRQASHQVTEEPARRFIDLLGSALAAGFAHVASIDGTEPMYPVGWGWRMADLGGGEYQRTEWRPQGARAGWIDGDDLYLDLEAAIAATQRVSQATGSGVAVSSKTLAKRLHERGFLRSIDTERGHLRVRRTLQGGRRSVLHLAASTIIAEESAQSAQSAQDTHEPTDSSHSTTGNGSIPWADYASAGQESAQEIDPFPAERGGNGPMGPIGTVIPA